MSAPEPVSEEQAAAERKTLERGEVAEELRIVRATLHALEDSMRRIDGKVAPPPVQLGRGGDYAFPSPDIAEPGLTIREYFAGQALQGIVANGNITDSGAIYAPDVTADCVKLADALIAELAK